MRLMRIASLILLLIFTFLPSSVDARRYKIIDRAQLEARVEALYSAEQGADWEKWYSLMAPTSREEMDYQEFLDEMAQREFSIVSWKIKKIRGTTRFHDEIDKHEDEELEIDPDRVSSVVEVSMEVYVEHNGKRTLEKDQTDYWMRYDGVWYWYWRGWPHD